ncbi:Arm DNA-binding domain-containing protein [Mucilaginibacter sabulilitoris]|uniref:Arm DNA-binding domain-containing protein n=1 Tax=Mucilaginibacter sabulilitoris TaxID=1173583 RepID=A0ABZ0TVS0_9SPHI|nr:Arm DNA-binding domain-containing protein [Mucilaginibacter sabulilitoris]WPU97014.1 Arm DNA-binding domain-containing protein [Mucilaginibacter sabulilitoris]
MKTTNSFGIHFNIRTDKERDGGAPVFAIITVNGQRASMVLKDRISVKSWDMKNGIGKSNTSEGKKVNVYLDETRQSITDCYKDLHAQRKVITSESLKAAYLRTGNDQSA